MRSALVTFTAILFVIPALAAAQNSPPIADAGPDQSVFVDAVAVLQGSATDPDNDTIVGWLWSVESAPQGSSPYISWTDIPNPDFIADVAGDYVLSLVVADALEWSLPDYVTIHVSELLPPEAVATADVTSGPAPLTVHFDGSESYDPQGGNLDYIWNFGDGTPRSSEVSPIHTYAEAGTYTATMTVFDSLGQSDFDFVNITATIPGGCDDGIDNDFDGLTDYPDDPECTSLEDSSELPECQDGLDNDEDGLTDYPNDPGCATAEPPAVEDPECMDGIDNDGDTFADYPDDPGCFSPQAPSETTACDDGIDNDADGYCDMPTSTCDQPGVTPGDEWCDVGWDDSENECGLGFELALLLPPLMWLRGWRRRRLA
jgi:PKD repeat protein